MKKTVDIKNSTFVEYPSNIELPILEGLLSNVYYKQVGSTLQFKVVLLNEENEITLNVITNTINYQILVKGLIQRQSNKIKLIFEENGNYKNIKVL